MLYTDSNEIQKMSPNKLIDNISTKDVDCIIFDCDGVLVDVSDSYYATIKETVSFVLHMVMPSVLFNKDDLVNHQIIEKFKDTGRYNDEIDLSCAIIIGAVIAAKTVRNTGDNTVVDGMTSVTTAMTAGNDTDNDTDNDTGNDTGNDANNTTDNHIDDDDDNDTSDIISHYVPIIDDIISNSAHGGINSVISYALNIADVSDVITYMEHPSDNRDGKLCKIFDQIFFGSDLYKKMRKRDPEIITHNAMINNDHVIMTPQVLRILYNQFNGHIAMVTGRGIDSARYTLGSLFDIFDIENSAFLEDEPRVYAKPNPAKLAECMQGMGCKNAIYVGDSIEDAIMSRMLSDATTLNHDQDAHDDTSLDKTVMFCGITGTSSNPVQRHNMLLHKGASMILDSVLDIPKALNLVK